MTWIARQFKLWIPGITYMCAMREGDIGRFICSSMGQDKQLRCLHSKILLESCAPDRLPCQQ